MIINNSKSSYLFILVVLVLVWFRLYLPRHGVGSSTNVVNMNEDQNDPNPTIDISNNNKNTNINQNTNDNIDSCPINNNRWINGLVSPSFLAYFSSELTLYKTKIKQKYSKKLKKKIDIFQNKVKTSNEDLIINKMVYKLHYGGRFVMPIHGTSIAAGHEVYHNQSWPIQLHYRLNEIYQKGDIEVSIPNQSIGNRPIIPAMLCLETMVGSSKTMNDKVDVLGIETAWHTPPQMELVIRRVAQHSDRPLLYFFHQIMVRDKGWDLESIEDLIEGMIDSQWVAKIQNRYKQSHSSDQLKLLETFPSYKDNEIPLDEYYKDNPGVSGHFMYELFVNNDIDILKDDYLLQDKVGTPGFYRHWHPGSHSHSLRADIITVHFCDVMLKAIEKYEQIRNNIDPNNDLYDENEFNDNIYKHHSSIILAKYRPNHLKDVVKLPPQHILFNTKEVEINKPINCPSSICDLPLQCNSEFLPRATGDETSIAKLIIDYGNGNKESVAEMHYDGDWQAYAGNAHNSWGKMFSQSDFRAYTYWNILMNSGHTDKKFAWEGGSNSGQIKLQINFGVPPIQTNSNDIDHSKLVMICEPPQLKMLAPQVELATHVKIKINEVYIKYIIQKSRLIELNGEITSHNTEMKDIINKANEIIPDDIQSYAILSGTTFDHCFIIPSPYFQSNSTNTYNITMESDDDKIRQSYQDELLELEKKGKKPHKERIVGKDEFIAFSHVIFPYYKE